MALKLHLSLLKPHPHNPRTSPDPEYIQELQQSMTEHGQWESILVRPLGSSRYQIIAGHCRVLAAGSLGWKEIRAEVRQMSDEEADFLLLDTNLKRRNLSEIEEAEGIQHMMQKHGWIQRKVAERFGRSQAWVSNRLALLTLSEPVKEAMITRVISPRTAAEIGRAPVDLQPSIAARVQQEDLSTRETEQLVKVVMAPETPADVKLAALSEPAVTPAHAAALAQEPSAQHREWMVQDIKAGRLTPEAVQRHAEASKQETERPPSVAAQRVVKRVAIIPPLVRARDALDELTDLTPGDQPADNLQDALRIIGELETRLRRLGHLLETEIAGRRAPKPAGKVVAMRKAT